MGPAKFGCGDLAGECGTISAVGCEADVDVGGSEDARTGIDGVGSQALVVAGPVGLLVVRRRDRVQHGEGRRAAEHLLGEHRVQLDPVELRAGERTGLVPDRVRDGGRAELVYESGPPQCRDGAVGESEQPGGVRAELAHRRLWPAIYGDFRSMKSAITVSASSSSAPFRVR